MTHDYLLEVNELRGEFCSTNIVFLKKSFYAAYGHSVEFDVGMGNGYSPSSLRERKTYQ